ncbi:hypothetical protein KJ596_00795 [Patescibacteria group bacterium]|nr:hypothetical protein [Patescibacteria group bacterium]MBU1868700.1 hypothetical protein [Patescibacteria group bacterium]
MDKSKIENVVEFINTKLEAELGTKLESVYLVGSYPQGAISLARPDINWLLIWKNFISGEELWQLGAILTSAISSFEDDFAVRPEFRPFKFSYPVNDTGSKDEVFVNITFAFAATTEEEFKRVNSSIPEYVFDGFKSSRKLILGKDILANMNFATTKQSILNSARDKIMFHHKIQLDRVPLTYHQEKQASLIFNEALSHGKNLLYFAVEILMSDEELANKDYLKLYGEKGKLLNYVKDRLPEAEESATQILEAREHYPEWKNQRNRAKEIYLASSRLALILLREVTR